MANILPEVRPEVISMSAHGFMMQTGGSARKRTIKFQSSDSSFPISGVPGHTHNSSAVVAIEADYTERRSKVINVSSAFGRVVGGSALALPAAITDSPAMVDEADRFDRAIERGVGQMTLLPENCQHMVQEPTKSISEIRTIVTGKNMLDTMTYVQELGGWVNPADGTTMTDVSFDDLHVSVLGYLEPFKNTEYSHPANDNIDSRTTSAPAQIFHTNSSVVFNVVKDGDESDRLGTTTGGDAWDGTLRFQWDDARRLYRSERTVIDNIRVYEVKDAQTAAVDTKLQVVFMPFESSVAQDGFCVFSNSGVAQTMTTATELNGNSFAPRLRVDIISGNTKLEDFTYWYGMASYRVRAGGAIVMPGPPRALASARSLDEGASLWQRFRNVQQARVVQEIMYQSINGPDSENDVAGLGTVYDAIFPKNSTRYPNIGHESKLRGIFYSGASNMSAGQYSRFGALSARDYNKIHGMNLGWYNINRRIVGLDENGDAYNPYEDDAISLTVTANPDVLERYGEGHGRCDMYEIGLQVQEKVLDADDQGFRYDPPNDDEDPYEDLDDYYDLDGIREENETGSGYLHFVQKIEMFSSENAEIFYADGGGGIFDNDDYVATETNQDYLTDRIDPDGNTELHTHGLYNSSGLYSYAATCISSPVYANVLPYIGELIEDGDYDFLEQEEIETFLCIMEMEISKFADKGGPYHRMIMQGRNEMRNVDKMEAYEGTRNAGSETFTIARHQAEGADQNYFMKSLYSSDTSTKTVDKLVAEAKVEYEEANPNGPAWEAGDPSPEDAATEVAEAAYAVAVAIIDDEYNEFARQGNCFQVPLPGAKAHVIRVLAGANDQAIVLLPNMVLPYSAPADRRVFLLTLQTKAAANGKRHQRVWYFTQEDISEVIIRRRVDEGNGAYAGEHTRHLYTKISKLRRHNPVANNYQTRDPPTLVQAETKTHLDTLMGAAVDVFVTVLPDTLSNLFFHDDDDSPGINDLYKYYKDESVKVGPVYMSKKRISQHVCAPILNPTKRLGCIAPLNYESRHLPPEMRDFRLRFDHINFDFLNSNAVEVKDLVLYQFNGGNQVQTAENSLMYLPQFREYKTTVVSGAFDFECRTNYGLPSFFCIFCRDADEFDRQPLIQRLSISSTTTMKKSDVVFETDVHELYHLTQRNVHPMAEYDHAAFNKRQVILLATEDIGTLGLEMDVHYQKAKRAGFNISGTVDRPGTVTVIFIYNNRGLAIEGRQLSVVRF